ncbi:MAG: helix-turn-helix domain-containing protein [Xenococcaceae cyanobacterium MO_207.B15]|nr:helix-turn-helix domain-containing protein [Xenococcaceae cyanobacterium MO_207.B15]
MTKLNSQNHLEQQQKLEEIGANLYRIRKEQGISLEAMANQTMIAKRVLVAIEQGAIDRLPEPFYTQALIKKYAQALGVKPIPDYTATAKPLRLPPAKQKKQSWLSRRGERSPLGFNQFQLSSVHLYLLYLVVIAISVKLVSFKITNNTVAVRDETLVESDSENNKSQLIQDSPSQLISQSNSSNLNEVVVNVSLKDRCWMKVIVDGNVTFEGTLAAGTHRTWKGTQEVTIIAGNAGGVIVTYNNGQEKLLGKPGQVQEVTYTVN